MVFNSAFKGLILTVIKGLLLNFGSNRIYIPSSLTLVMISYNSCALTV